MILSLVDSVTSLYVCSLSVPSSSYVFNCSLEP